MIYKLAGALCLSTIAAKIVIITFWVDKMQYVDKSKWGGLEFTAEETGAHGYCNSLHQNEKLKIRILRYGPCMWLKTKVAISKQGWNQRFENPCKKSLNVRKIMRDLKHSVTKFIQIHTFSSFCTHFSFYYLFPPSVPSFHPISSFVSKRVYFIFNGIIIS